MANFGRFACVVPPLALTIAAIVAFMVAVLTGVAHDDLYLFQLDVEDLSIDPFDLRSLSEDLGVNGTFQEGLDTINDAANDAADDVREHANGLGESIIEATGGHRLMIRQDVQTENITAEVLGLARIYDVSLWGYCYVEGDNDERHCTDSEFGWAMNTINDTYLGNFTTPTGVEVRFPDEITGPLRAFREVSRWTGIVFVIALVVLGVELVVGITANFSRVMSCVTWVIGIIAIGITCAAASLATAQAALVVGAVEATARRYGVRGDINWRFLVIVWLGFVFTLAANVFWLFTVCCCKPERRSSRRGSGGEKFLPTDAYRPIGNDHEMTTGPGAYNQSPNLSQPTSYYNPSQTQYGAPRSADRSDLAYEPYSHRS